jgi:hypothetical protein
MVCSTFQIDDAIRPACGSVLNFHNLRQFDCEPFPGCVGPWVALVNVIQMLSYAIADVIEPALLAGACRCAGRIRLHVSSDFAAFAIVEPSAGIPHGGMWFEERGAASLREKRGRLPSSDVPTTSREEDGGHRRCSAARSRLAAKRKASFALEQKRSVSRSLRREFASSASDEALSGRVLQRKGGFPAVRTVGVGARVEFHDGRGAASFAWSKRSGSRNGNAERHRRKPDGQARLADYFGLMGTY